MSNRASEAAAASRSAANFAAAAEDEPEPLRLVENPNDGVPLFFSPAAPLPLNTLPNADFGVAYPDDDTPSAARCSRRVLGR